MHIIQGADELHAGVVGAPQLGGHALHLRPVQHPHEDGLDDVVEVVPEGDLVAAQALRLFVQIPPPHARAQVAGVFGGGFRRREYGGVEDVQRDAQQLRVFFDEGAVLRRIAGVHGQKMQLEGDIRMAVQLLHALCKQHGIFPARNAHGDAVALLYQRVFFDALDEPPPDALAAGGDDAALDLFAAAQNAPAGRFSFFRRFAPAG